ncbi:MAG TPA: hypothetical protein VLH86_03090 [Patescibacteria group bacterium]|nr:hypothetical protein [Patescibacteria group bacterium]
MTKASQKVAIVYGFNEGPHMGKRLIRALEAGGFEMVADPAQADIIIAHSGGCYILTAEHAAKRIICVGLPYWPGHSTFVALCRKIWRDALMHHREGEFKYWLHKSMWNMRYFWHMRANWQMVQGRLNGTLWKLPDVTVVRYSQDPFCTPNLAELPFEAPVVLVELSGHHDDCWRTPQQILHVVQS